jgi:hypothetical protein
MGKLKRWLPTDKWIAAASTGVAAIVSSWIATEGFDKDERMMLAALIPSLVGSYWVSNKDRLTGA